MRIGVFSFKMKCDNCNIEMDDNVCPNCKTICNDCADKWESEK